jgi:class 3 adenylate cyclase
LTSTNNRTFICSVVFIDVVNYTTKSVQQQIAIKSQLNRFINEATKNVAFNDRIIIDTGDGAAICFLGDPEDALFVAMNLQSTIAGAGKSTEEPLFARFGINLGPVKLVKDINDRENLIGDGINTAQRIMNFAEAGQLLVSRSYYEVVSCLTREYADLFHYIGMRADKNIRNHEIYGIKQTIKQFTDPIQIETEVLEKKEMPILGATLIKESYKDPLPPIYAPVPENEGVTISSHSITPPEQSFRLKNLFYSSNFRLACYVFLLIVVIIPILFLIKRPYSNSRETASPSQRISPVQVSGPEIPGKEDSENIQPIKIVNPESGISPLVTSAVQESQREMPGKEASENVQPDKDANPEPENTTVESPPARKTIVQFAISPWGDVYLDGKNIGASPPLTNQSIEPGKHHIEIKNSSFPVYSRTFNAKPDEKLKITHKFQ